MFIDEKSGIQIHADLNCSVSTATLRPQDLLPVYLNIIRDTPEYIQLSQTIPSHVFENDDADWWCNEGNEFVFEVVDVLNSYAPYGFFFSSTEGNGSDFGYWVVAELINDPDVVISILKHQLNPVVSDLEQYRKECGNIFDSFETVDDILSDFNYWKEQNEIIFQKIQDANYYSSL